MSKKHHHTRRAFLGNLSYGCASLSLAPLLSGWTNMGLINAAAAANRPAFGKKPPGDYKALVCILLAGGNDSFNMLVPRGTDEYAEYASVRTNLALDQNTLRAINPLNPDGKDYGLHPSLENIQTMFEAGNAAMIANVGALVEPTSISDYNQDKNLPLGLYSHSDQQQHWQTSVPNDRNAMGWGGRLADIMHTNNMNNDISMNISLDGLNLYQRGNIIQPYAISSSGNGSVLLNGSSSNNFYETLKRQTVDSLLEQNYQNILEKAYAESVAGSQNNSLAFNSAIANGDPITTTFPIDRFGAKMEMAAKTIAARNILDVSNQTFFIELGGFDTHDNVILEHAALMTQLDEGIQAFFAAMDELGLGNDVTAFTMSDFGRKLVSNGDGADHAWGGHSMVFGGAVQGKKIYGEFPDLYLGNSLDTGEGRLIPSTSCDEYFAELALWFGASSSDINQIFPNINNFWTPDSQSAPIGFMNL